MLIVFNFSIVYAGAFVIVCLCVRVLITASVVVIALGYKHHQSPEEMTLLITALFVGLLKRLNHRSTKSSMLWHERRVCD